MSTLRTGGVVLTLAAALTLGLAGRRVTRMTVVGHSMSPTLHDGERLWLRRPSRGHRYKAGQIIAFEHERGHGTPPMLVKRVAHAQCDGIIVRGDALRTLDSRQLGPIPTASVRGIVLGRRR